MLIVSGAHNRGYAGLRSLVRRRNTSPNMKRPAPSAALKNTDHSTNGRQGEIAAGVGRPKKEKSVLKLATSAHRRPAGGSRPHGVATESEANSNSKKMLTIPFSPSSRSQLYLTVIYVQTLEVPKPNLFKSVAGQLLQILINFERLPPTPIATAAAHRRTATSIHHVSRRAICEALDRGQPNRDRMLSPC
jgi:hypothetical protein